MCGVGVLGGGSGPQKNHGVRGLCLQTFENCLVVILVNFLDFVIFSSFFHFLRFGQPMHVPLSSSYFVSPPLVASFSVSRPTPKKMH